jgi:molecular chaperone HtpG
MKLNNFQVNLEGIVSLLSSHLYSSPKVYVRELVQNSVDAITARMKLEPGLNPSIRIQVVPGDRPSLVFEDNGIGLSMDEVQEFLSSIGSSSKRENGRSSDDFIGQFGIGLLAAFMVTDEIVMITRSAKGGPAMSGEVAQMVPTLLKYWVENMSRAQGFIYVPKRKQWNFVRPGEYRNSSRIIAS